MDWEWQEVNPGVESEDPLTRAVIGAAIEVHEALGPGLLESAYEACLAHERRARGMPFRTRVELPIVYRGHEIGAGYRLDFLIDDRLIVELKAVEKPSPSSLTSTPRISREGSDA